jgi:phosphoglycerate dehydrogenase-like enzyme
MDKPKIISFLPYPEERFVSLFKARNRKVEYLRIDPGSEKSEDKTCEMIREARVIVAYPRWHISKKMLESAKNVRLIQTYSVGFDNIDIETANELGIPVANNPGWNSSSAAEHTLMLILMTLKKAIYASRKSVEKDWKRGELTKVFEEAMELRGKTLGIVGLGAIGKEVARLARVFGARIIYNKLSRLSVEDENCLGVTFRSLEELLAESDIVSLHVPLNDDTRNMISHKEIALMKDGAIIINSARAGILDEYAATEALKTGKLFGVGFDVTSYRRIDGALVWESPLFELSNAVFTPHQAGNTREAMMRANNQWVDNVCRLLDGEEPLFIVNNT